MGRNAELQSRISELEEQVYDGGDTAQLREQVKKQRGQIAQLEAKLKQAKKALRKQKKTRSGSPSRDLLLEPNALSRAGRSASVVQRHMRGYLARRQVEQKIDSHLDEEIEIPTFGHLDEDSPTPRDGRRDRK